MRYMRCECGKSTCWTSMGHPSCDPCAKCGTTLAESPDGHVPVTEHRWSDPEWKIDAKTGGRWQERKCIACMKKERVFDAEAWRVRVHGEHDERPEPVVGCLCDRCRAIGQRIEYSGDGIPANGCYWRDGRDGNWYGMTPNGHLAGLAKHNVVEHEDGTITVAPSIKVSGVGSDDGIRVTDGVRELWHGYLERGVWRSC